MVHKYANSFGVNKVTNQSGEIIEVSLNFLYKYIDHKLTVTQNGVEDVSMQSMEDVAAIVMNRQNALALRDLMNKVLDEDSI